MVKLKLNKLSRRDAFVLIGAFSAYAISPLRVNATEKKVLNKINQITNGKEVIKSDLFLDLPEIAENGNQVKVAFEIESPMSANDFVKEVYILADGNPATNVAKFTFTPDLGSCSATTRMRLSKTQNVYLLAAYNDGKFAVTKSKVKVTIGGCGG